MYLTLQSVPEMKLNKNEPAAREAEAEGSQLKASMSNTASPGLKLKCKSGWNQAWGQMPIIQHLQSRSRKTKSSG